MRPPRLTIHRRRPRRRGFNLVEMLIAMAITSALLSATMVALDASFMAYQSTTEVASTHTVSRLAMLRMMTLIRTGQEFGPFPINPQDSIVESTEIEFLTPSGQLVRIEWFEIPDGAHPVGEALYVVVDGGTPQLLLEGVIPAFDEFNQQIAPFTMEYELGRKLYRATVDITIVPDDNMSVELDGDNQQEIRLVATAMPRIEAYQFD
ncbi:MAG: prepilin-type N-terminal cleavage/methylation domain-containing protein [Planctomycetota bacterium]